MYDTQRREAQIPFVTGVLCLMCVLVFAGIHMTNAETWAQLARWGYYSPSAIFKGAYWGQVTSAFVHIDPIHLVFNLYWLWILGGAFERRFGWLALLVFVVVSAFVSSGFQFFTGDGGIGMSGVGYALFGFGWMARRRVPEFARIVDDRTVKLFVGWGILCVVLTYAKVWQIANFAHLGGFIFGAVCGAGVAWPERRVFAAVGLLVLVALGIVPLFWNPLSVDWTVMQATEAAEKHQPEKAIPLYRRAIDLGVDAEWGWYNLAAATGYQWRTNGTHKDDYAEALRRLKTISPENAAGIEQAYGAP